MSISIAQLQLKLLHRGRDFIFLLPLRSRLLRGSDYPITNLPTYQILCGLDVASYGKEDKVIEIADTMV